MATPSRELAPETRTVEAEVKLQSRASVDQQEARAVLQELFLTSPLPPEQLLVNLGLYMRSSVIAKLLYVNELYTQVLSIPGVIMEFGVWWGQNLALFESLRAVYEPYNYTRKVIGFDTFDGYTAISAEDGDHELVAAGQYAVGGGPYVRYLERLLDYHQRENVMSHVRKFELVSGDATVTTGEYLRSHPETIVALAYFDMQLYEPTRACLEALKPHLVRGSVIALDELNSDEFPGETIALREVFGLDRFRIQRSRFLPDRSYMIIE
jgi:hypothetical protein